MVLIESSVSVGSNVGQSQLNLPQPKMEEIKSRYGYTPIVRILISATDFYNEQYSAVELLRLRGVSPVSPLPPPISMRDERPKSSRTTQPDGMQFCRS
jgi:hypothetical protein